MVVAEGGWGGRWLRGGSGRGGGSGGVEPPPPGGRALGCGGGRATPTAGGPPGRVRAPPMLLPPNQANSYVRAIVDSETRAVTTAQTGTRHRTLLGAARTLGRLVAGGELDKARARAALCDAAALHIGIDGCS